MADLIPSVRDALCDNEELVRKAAGVCFQTLLRNVQKRAVDDIVPALLWSLDEEQGDAFKSNLVLEGIKMVLSINSSDVLPYLIPALAKTPLTLYHAKSLAFLSGNFSKGFHRYVENVTLRRCSSCWINSARTSDHSLLHLLPPRQPRPPARTKMRRPGVPSASCSELSADIFIHH